MRYIPLLAEEGWLRHQGNAAKPQRRRRRARSASAIARSRNSGQFGWPSKGCRTDHPVRDKSERIHCFSCRGHPSSARRGMCCPENFVQKTKTAWLHKAEHRKHKNLCLLCSPFAPFVCLFYLVKRSSTTLTGRGSIAWTTPNNS